MTKIISRKEAKTLGVKTYFTGKPCKHGHVCERSLKKRDCVECVKIKNKQWSTDNKEYSKRYKKQYRKNKAEHVLEQRQQYYKDHKEYINERNKQWNKDNEEHIKLYKKEWAKQNYIINKEYINYRNKNYKKNNPGKNALYLERRDNYIKKYTPIWYELELVTQIYLKRDELNKKWKLKGKDRYQVDHIIPIISDTVCGLHCWANLQLLDSELNRSKYNNYQKDW